MGRKNGGRLKKRKKGRSVVPSGVGNDVSLRGSGENSDWSRGTRGLICGDATMEGTQRELH